MRYPSSRSLRAQHLAQFFQSFRQFLHIEAVSGVVLLATAAAALLWANSPLASFYHSLWESPVTLGIGGHALTFSLHFVVNELLMTVFFLVVGMEIRREMHDGALADVRAAALPLAAALGGVAVPAVIYLAFNSASGLRDGWAIPTATDIAFAVGVLALLGKSVPPAMRILLLALAIIDDIAAVIIIAVFYTGGLDYSGVPIAAAGVLLVFCLQRFGVATAYAYIIPGAIVWLGLLQIGAHPTLAGVALGLMTPVVAKRESLPPVVRVQRALHPWVAFAIMPLFAFANAGVALDETALRADDAQSILLGVACALVVGKPIGIYVGSWIAVKLGWCRLPAGVTWYDVAIVGCLGGIGFTMSIFIATLAFANPELLAAAKLGVLLASVVAGVMGLLLGLVRYRTASERARRGQPRQ